MGDMEFAKVHNFAIFLEDPPAAHNDLKFIVDGLKKSCLVHDLTTSPTIYQSLIKDFWRSVVVKKNDQGEKFVEVTIEDKKIQRGNDTLDFKSIGPSAFGLMKQKRCRKFVFEGKFPLIKFGIFKENDREESKEQSIPMQNEDGFHSPSEPEVQEIHDSPTACMAGEHDLQKANESKSTREEDDDDLYDDVEFLKEIDFTGINDDIPTNIEFDLGDENFDPFLEIPNISVNKVNAVASLATKTRNEGNVLNILLSTSNPLEVAPSQGDVIVG
ncbi:unnamed protein product [Lactuca saligna]|uniref:Uncharacterized protein n=1 Tax=Lactuca saligna TaxID=75948 RepID=A0AA35Z2Q7_LACSI|nr:unnamed protein product [Lactuca saligna]